MAGQRKSFHWILLTVIFGIIGGTGGCVYTSFYVQGWFAKWEYLGTMPEKPYRFLTLEPTLFDTHLADVYIEAISGSIYRFNAKKRYWEESPPPSSSNYFECGGSERLTKQQAFTKLPKEIFFCGQFDWSWEGTRDTSYYVVLDDGSLWTWNFQAGHGTTAPIGNLCWNPLMVICVGWVMTWLVHHIKLTMLFTGKIKVTIIYLTLGLGAIALIVTLYRIAAPIANGLVYFVFLNLLMFANNAPLLFCILFLIAIPLILMITRRENGSSRTTYEDFD